VESLVILVSQVALQGGDMAGCELVVRQANFEVANGVGAPVYYLDKVFQFGTAYSGSKLSSMLTPPD
jgi:hypothetical protein